MSKKTIILVVAVLVIIVVAFVFFRKKDEVTETNLSDTGTNGTSGTSGTIDTCTIAYSECLAQSLAYPVGTIRDTFFEACLDSKGCSLRPYDPIA